MQHMNGLKKSRQAGFTLIELIVVIVILGILAATALPRFFDVATDARKSAVAGIAGGFTAGVAMEHSKWLTAGSNLDSNSVCVVDAAATTIAVATYKSCTATAATTWKALIDGATVGFNSYGYPIGDNNASINATGQVDSLSDVNCVTVWNTVLGNGRPTIDTKALAATSGHVVDWSAQLAPVVLPADVVTTAAATTTTPAQGLSSGSDTCLFTYHGGSNVPTKRTFTYNTTSGEIVLNNM